jgi:glycosyltransferase involved in cell wall biosynthesis
MQYLIVHRKADGVIVRVLSRNQGYKESLVTLGFNPVTHGIIRVVSSERISPTRWKVNHGVLVPLYSREQELMKTLATDKEEKDGYKILFVGDPPSANTGFGIQYRLLQEGFERRGHNVNSIRYQNIPQLIDMNADFIIVLSDYGSIHSIFELGLNNLIYWFALESPTWPDAWSVDLRKIPHIIPLTEYGAKALKEKEIPSDNPIPHGVQVDSLRPIPLPQRGVLRKQNEVDNKFVISYLGTNVKRKRLDLLIKAYATFVKNYDQERKSILLLKTKISGHYDIVQLIGQLGEQLGIENFSSMIKVLEKEMSLQEVNQFINISDLGFNATSGEGFCVPTIEYLMCGVPFLAGKHTSFPELIGNHLPLVSVDDIEIDPQFHWTRYNIDSDHAAQLISQYYLNWKNRRIYDRQKLREIALHYSSDIMIQRWERYFKEIERKNIEAEYIKKATSSLLQVDVDEGQQRLYERAVRAVENTPSQTTHIQWIKVF